MLIFIRQIQNIFSFILLVITMKIISFKTRITRIKYHLLLINALNECLTITEKQVFLIVWKKKMEIRSIVKIMMVVRCECIFICNKIYLHVCPSFGLYLDKLIKGRGRNPGISGITWSWPLNLESFSEKTPKKNKIK